MLTARQIEDLIAKVSHKMMHMNNQEGFEEKYPVDLIDMNAWEWPQGVGLYGLYKYYQQCGAADIRDFLEGWFDQHIAQGGMEKNVNSTAPLLTLAHLYEELPKPAYRQFIDDWCAWIMDEENGLVRTGDDGAFQHMITGDPNNGEILIDTIFMTLLFLAKAGALLGRREYVDEANYQLQLHLLYLYEKKSGLFFHGWNFDKQSNYGKVFWSRGNSWYTVGLLELFDMVPDIDPALKKGYLNIFRHQCKALMAVQDEKTALWHTVLDDEGSYIEISACAGFLAGILKGLRLGVLDKGYEAQIHRAVESIVGYIDEDGTVTDVSYGTSIGNDKQFYRDIPLCPMTYGQALMILFLQELLHKAE